MKNSNLKNIGIIILHAFILWILCAATIGIGRSFFNMNLVLMIHAIMAPVYAILISGSYYKRFSYTTPLVTAIIFLLFVVILDAGLVAPVFEKSYDMFRSVSGTWLPFSLIFLAAFLTGLVIKRKNVERH
jgi:hypothetical protein